MHGNVSGRIECMGDPEKKRILVFCWSNALSEDCIRTLEELGYPCCVLWGRPKDYLRDEELMARVESLLAEGDFCAIFSLNYFPFLSDLAMTREILYLSWVYDSPMLTLEALNLSNPSNRVFIFDYLLYEKYRRLGVDTVYYLPLPCNVRRLDQVVSGLSNFLYDMTFLGNLYTGTGDFYSQIGYLPPRLKGYLDAVIHAQLQVSGADLVGELMTDEVCEEMGIYVKAGLGEGYRTDCNRLLQDIVRRGVTARERTILLEYLCSYALDTDRKMELYADEPPRKSLNLRYHGKADYLMEMPLVFHGSRINYNFTLRTILSGIPLRVIDILGAGGFCMTNYQSELPEYFENGKHLVWFSDPEEMLDRTDYYLRHEEERAEIAIRGRERVEECFEIRKLMKKLLREAGVNEYGGEQNEL